MRVGRIPARCRRRGISQRNTEPKCWYIPRATQRRPASGRTNRWPWGSVASAGRAGGSGVKPARERAAQVLAPREKRAEAIVRLDPARCGSYARHPPAARSWAKRAQSSAVGGAASAQARTADGQPYCTAVCEPAPARTTNGLPASTRASTFATRVTVFPEAVNVVTSMSTGSAAGRPRCTAARFCEQ